MLFITNCEPKGFIRTKRGRDNHFDLNKNGPSNSVYFYQRAGKDNYAELGATVGRNGFYGETEKSRTRQVLLFIHGFSNLPEPDIF